MNPFSLPFTPVLHAIAQALFAPVIAILLASLVYLAYQAGVFCGEWRTFRAFRLGRPGSASARLGEVVDEARAGAEPGVLAERALAAEELSLQRRLEKTDLLVRLGPALGLTGTLVPLGPGLAALGRGEVRLLAESLTVAFDTTILGLLVGGAAFALSTVRRRWYEEYLLGATAWVEDRLNQGAAAAAVPAAAHGAGEGRLHPPVVTVEAP